LSVEPPPVDPEWLLTIDAPHFNAGLLVRASDRVVVRAAPILHYMLGWTQLKVVEYASHRGWRVIGHG
jgi:hypothetical protein